MHMSDYSQIVTIISLWCGFFVIHSVTASLTLKQWVARNFNHLMPAYRLAFNALSALLLVPLLLLSYLWRSEPLWHWSPPLFWITTVITVLTIIAFIISIRYYDMSEFLGTHQWQRRIAAVEDQEQFVIGDFHRFVRHPWYSMAIILIWCREMDPIMLANAIMLTIYFIIGSRLEEKKLIHYHGKIYQHYQQKVPGLLPLPWKYLSKAEAESLINNRSVM
jgi:protein-S-isoprenylcysteine O-methyltransferase Ste14